MTGNRSSGLSLFARLYRDETLSLRALSRQLACAPDGFAGSPRSALRRLLVSPAPPQFAKEPLALELPLEEFQRLIDVVVADEDLDDLFLFGSGAMGFGWADRVARRVRAGQSAYRREPRLAEGWSRRICRSDCRS